MHKEVLQDLIKRNYPECPEAAVHIYVPSVESKVWKRLIITLDQLASIRPAYINNYLAVARYVFVQPVPNVSIAVFLKSKESSLPLFMEIPLISLNFYCEESVNYDLPTKALIT